MDTRLTVDRYRSAYQIAHPQGETLRKGGSAGKGLQYRDAGSLFGAESYDNARNVGSRGRFICHSH